METGAGDGADWFTRPAEAAKGKSDAVLSLNAYLSPIFLEVK